MIHGPDGQKLSKRHGAVSVLQYEEDGYLPEAVINYLARLGWSHGDDGNLQSRASWSQWFDGEHLSHSPSQLDFDKFRWVNHQYLKAMDDTALAAAILPRLRRRLSGPEADALEPAPDAQARLAAICGLWKDRASTLEELADLAAIFFTEPTRPAEALSRHLTEPAVVGVGQLAGRLATCDWTRPAIAACLKAVLADAGLKMPQLAVPVRLLVFGMEQTPSVDAMLALMPRETVLSRLAAAA